nr:DNA repair protein RAD51 homolog 3 [Andalucia godoyi]|eukprot:ANDGO_03808.mRNA.1 DNA repair protein RAD51 homolog 3
MASRDVSSLPIAPQLRHKLISCGFTSTSDVIEQGVANLRASLQISASDARGILRACSGSFTPSSEGVSAFALLQKRQSFQPVVTFSRALDLLLGGGVPCGSLTEFCGPPGVGKTQLAMQIAVDTVIPKELGGCAGSALYIDTEGSFSKERLAMIAEAMIDLVKVKCSHLNTQYPTDLSVESVLDRVQYCRVHDMTEQLSVILSLPQYLGKHPSCRTIIIDSIAFHFRHDFSDQLGQRSRLLQSLAQRLADSADKFGVAIVLTNQVTTRIRGAASVVAAAHLSLEDGASGIPDVVPALGESWGHACTHRILLAKGRDGKRYASVYKSPSLPPNRICFAITDAGIRDDPSIPFEEIPDLTMAPSSPLHTCDFSSSAVASFSASNESSRS